MLAQQSAIESTAIKFMRMRHISEREFQHRRMMYFAGEIAVKVVKECWRQCGIEISNGFARKCVEKFSASHLISLCRTAGYEWNYERGFWQSPLPF